MGAVEYCRYLNLDGETLNCSGGSCSIVDYWHLPTEGELLKGIADQFISGTETGFQSVVYYWSSSVYYAPEYSWIGDWTGNFVDTIDDNKITRNMVRCVH